MNSDLVQSGVAERFSFVERHASTLGTAVPLISAVVAAVLVLLIGRSAGHWQLQRFFEDIVRNVFLGALVAVLLLWLRSRERALDKRREDRAARDRFHLEVEQRRRTGRMVVTRTQLLSGDRPADVSAELGTRSDRLSESATQLSAFHERWPDPTAADGNGNWDADARQAAGLVWEYVQHGHRSLLRLYLERIARELPTGVSPTKDIYASADERFRDTCGKFLGGRIATDAAVAEQLMVTPLVQDGSAPSGAPGQPPDAVATDCIAVGAVEPLYLLYISLVRTVGRPESLAEGQSIGALSSVTGRLAQEMRCASDALRNLSHLVHASSEEALANMARL